MIRTFASASADLPRMPDVSPFRGVRYDVARVGTLSDVVAPPYDVIDPALQDRLYQASPYNVIRLELNRDEPGDSGAHDRYTRAARFLKDWLRAGHSPPGRSPRALRLHQTFEVDGQDAHAQGVPGAGPTGAVRPGEDLSARADPRRPQGRPPGPLPCDRVQPQPDLRALSRRHRGGAPQLEAGLRDRTPLVATDHLGVENRLWIVTDQETHTVVSGLMAAKPVFIADGHHRYETGLKYRDEIGREPASHPATTTRPILPDDARRHERSRAADSADAPAGLGFSRI